MAGRVEDRRKSGRRPARARRRRYPRVKLGLDGFYESDDRALMIGGCNLSLRYLYPHTCTRPGRFQGNPETLHPARQVTSEAIGSGRLVQRRSAVRSSGDGLGVRFLAGLATETRGGGADSQNRARRAEGCAVAPVTRGDVA